MLYSVSDSVNSMGFDDLNSGPKWANSGIEANCSEYKSCLEDADFSAGLVDFGRIVSAVVDLIGSLTSMVGTTLISNGFSFTFWLYCNNALSKLTGDTLRAKIMTTYRYKVFEID